MNNAYLIFKDGVLIGEGEGRMPNLMPGEEIKWRDSLDDVQLEPTSIHRAEMITAQDSLDVANNERDKQAYIAKAACAKEFLENVPDTGVKGDPSVIPAACQELFEEYSETHDLIDMSPWDLARLIVEKSSTATREASRRRKKLLALQALQTPAPEAPNE